MRTPRFLSNPELPDLSTTWVSTRHLKLNMLQNSQDFPSCISKWQLCSSSCLGPNLGLFFDAPLHLKMSQSDPRFWWLCLWNLSTVLPLLTTCTTTALPPTAARWSVLLILHAKPYNGFSLFFSKCPPAPSLSLRLSSLPSLLQPFAVVWLCQACFCRLRSLYLLSSLPGMLSPQITTQPYPLTSFRLNDSLSVITLNKFFHPLCSAEFSSIALITGSYTMYLFVYCLLPPSLNCKLPWVRGCVYSGHVCIYTC